GICNYSLLGKTCMLIRFSQNSFDTQHDATIGSSFLKQVIETPNGKVELNLWDTSGDERFRSVMPVYFRGATSAIIVYDVTRRDTFESLDYWIDLTKKSGGDNILIVLVAAKCDLEKVISDDEGKRYAKKVGYPLVLCSSYSGQGVSEVFQKAALAKRKINQSGRAAIGSPNDNNNEGCC
ncbi:Rab family gtpase, partial [Entamoeba invadens IP1]